MGVSRGCRSCGRIYRSQTCFKRLRETQITPIDRVVAPCQQFYQCKKCNITLQYHNRTPDQHVCHERQCPNCKEYSVGQHLCFQKAHQSSFDERKKNSLFFMTLKHDKMRFSTAMKGMTLPPSDVVSV